MGFWIEQPDKSTDIYHWSKQILGRVCGEREYRQGTGATNLRHVGQGRLPGDNDSRGEFQGCQIWGCK